MVEFVNTIDALSIFVNTQSICCSCFQILSTILIVDFTFGNGQKTFFYRNMIETKAKLVKLIAILCSGW